MTWLDNANRQFKEAMKPFEGKSFHCALCGVEGEYDKNLDPMLTRIGQFSVSQGDVYKVLVETSFRCKDNKACQKRLDTKGGKPKQANNP